ncbi:MAG TPA: Pvc16 family protein [Fimbriimonadaceae bacterium]|nr:Pvc16 family protein [Fimbriimonadaceae bacterium]
MIQEVDETLRQLILTELAKKPGNLIKEAGQISFVAPAAAEAAKGKPTINLYLHDIRENTRFRDPNYHHDQRPGSDQKARRRGSVRLDLAYLITAHSGGDAVVEHQLLSDVIGLFLRNTTVPEQFLGDSLKPEGPLAVLLSVAQADHPAHSDPQALWQALGGNLRPAVGLIATASFNPFDTHLVKVVREALLGIGQGIEGDEAGRPLDVKSVRVSAAGLVSDADQRPLRDVFITIDGRDETTRTDDRGFFYFKNLPPNRYRLTFAKKGFASKEVETVAPPPGRSDSLEPIGIVLDGLGDRDRQAEQRSIAESNLNGPGLVEVERKVSISIVGRLKYPDGRPAAYIPVRAGTQTTMTDGEGMYHFAGLPAGDHPVIAEVAGHGDVSVAEEGGTGLLRLDEGAAKPAKAKSR